MVLFASSIFLYTTHRPIFIDGSPIPSSSGLEVGSCSTTSIFGEVNCSKMETPIINFNKVLLMEYDLLFSCILVAIISGISFGFYIHGKLHESQPQSEEEENIVRMIRSLNGIYVKTDSSNEDDFIKALNDLSQRGVIYAILTKTGLFFNLKNGNF